MKDKLYYFILGFSTMGIVAVIILSLYPLKETTESCSNCGMSAWYFKVVEEE